MFADDYSGDFSIFVQDGCGIDISIESLGALVFFGRSDQHISDDLFIFTQQLIAVIFSGSEGGKLRHKSRNIFAVFFCRFQVTLRTGEKGSGSEDERKY